MDSAPAPRVYPWVVLGFAVGVGAAAVVGLGAWGRADEVTGVTVPNVVAVCAITILFSVVIGLGVGQFIRLAGIFGAWQPALPTVLESPPPSTNGHGSPRPEPRRQVTNGAFFAVVSAVTAILAGPVVIPLLPAPLVLGVGALALDERTWVRVTASAGLFIAALSLAGFLISSTIDGGAAGFLFLVAIVAIGVVGVFTGRRVRPDTV